MCVSMCGNHLLVRTITCHPFKHETPNLDQKSKTPWLRSLLFLFVCLFLFCFCFFVFFFFFGGGGVIDLELQSQIELKSKKLPYFELVHAIIPHLSKIRFTNLDQKCTLTLSRSLVFWACLTLSFSLIFNFNTYLVPT